MYILILNIAKAIKKMSINEIKDVIFENYYKTIVFSKDSSQYSLKSLRKKDLLLLAHKSLQKNPLIIIKLKITINHL